MLRDKTPEFFDFGAENLVDIYIPASIMCRSCCQKFQYAPQQTPTTRWISLWCPLLIRGSCHMLMFDKGIMHNRLIHLFLVCCLVLSMLTGCGIKSQHLEVTYEENTDDNIHGWEGVDDNNVTGWDNATIVSWADIDEYSDWVYSELLFGNVTKDMPIIEWRELDYQPSGKYFDGEKVYRMVGDKFDVNSFVAKYAIGTGVIVICVVLNVVTAGMSTPVTCFIAGAAQSSVSMAIKGAAFGAATKAIITAIKSGGDVEETLYGALEGSADGYMWGAIYGAATGGFKSKFCFTEDTLVKTVYGLKYISEINIGDLVYSYDEHLRNYDYKPVTQIAVGQTMTSVFVHVGEEVIKCTPTHPFLTDTGWVQASKLNKGSRLLSVSNQYQVVTAVETTDYALPTPTYTLCVDDYHSFLVGTSGIVVHNRCKPNEKYANKTYKFPKGSKQATKYPNGVPFDAEGYPIFDQYATKTVKFDFPSPQGKSAGTCLTGNCSSDFKLANQAAGLSSTPPGYTWHHCQDMMTMQLVPQDVHSVVFGGVAHAGGESALAEFWASLTSQVIP